MNVRNTPYRMSANATVRGLTLLGLAGKQRPDNRDYTLSPVEGMIGNMNKNTTVGRATDSHDEPTAMMDVLAAHVDTVVIYLDPADLLEEIKQAAVKAGICLYVAQCAIDLVAVPCFLSIVNPALLSADEWQLVCDVHQEASDHDNKFLLTRPSPHKAVLPVHNRITTPPKIDENFLKFLFLRLRATVARQRAIHEKTERRMLRLMYVLRQLEVQQSLRLQDVAHTFETSLRTVQRDLQLLIMAGHPIDGPDKTGAYRFPKNYRAYEIYECHFPETRDSKP